MDCFFIACRYRTLFYSCMYLLLIGYCSITICRTMQRVSYWTASSLLAFISQTIRFFGFSSSFTIDFQFYTSCHRFLELQCAWLHFSNNIDKGNAGGQILVCFFFVIPSSLHGSELLVLKSVCSFYPSLRYVIRFVSLTAVRHGLRRHSHLRFSYQSSTGFLVGLPISVACGGFFIPTLSFPEEISVLNVFQMKPSQLRPFIPNGCLSFIVLLFSSGNECEALWSSGYILTAVNASQ